MQHQFKDGSLIVEESVNGLLISFDKNGNKEWEFVNKDSKGDIYYLNRFSVIENKDEISDIVNSINGSNCKKNMIKQIIY